MKHKIRILFVTTLLAFACAGCAQVAGGKDSQSVTGGNPEYGNNGFQAGTGKNSTDENNGFQTGTGKDSTDENNGSQTGDDENPYDADELFQICNLSGRVTEFTEAGCKVSPDREGGEGELIGAAPGYEDEGEQVSVLYEPECSFRIAHADIKTTTVTYEAATAEDVKKQTSLLICGEYDENDVLYASRVFIYRIEGK